MYFLGHAPTPAAPHLRRPHGGVAATVRLGLGRGARRRHAARLYLHGAYYVHRDAVTVPGRAFTVQGVVRPYVAGQKVRVVTTLGQRRIKTDVLRVKPLAGGRAGAFTETVRSPAAGLARVTVTHQRSAQMVGFIKSRAVSVLVPAAGYGAERHRSSRSSSSCCWRATST